MAAIFGSSQVGLFAVGWTNWRAKVFQPWCTCILETLPLIVQEFLCLFSAGSSVTSGQNRRRRNSTCCWIGTSGGPVQKSFSIPVCWRRHEQSSRSSKARHRPNRSQQEQLFVGPAVWPDDLANLLAFGDMVTASLPWLASFRPALFWRLPPPHIACVSRGSYLASRPPDHARAFVFGRTG